jgi:hypothetical protein
MPNSNWPPGKFGQWINVLQTQISSAAIKWDCLGTYTANGPIIRDPGHRWGNGMEIEGENLSSRRNICPSPPQSPHRLQWAWTRGTDARSWRLTAWAIARFSAVYMVWKRNSRSPLQEIKLQTSLSSHFSSITGLYNIKPKRNQLKLVLKRVNNYRIVSHLQCLMLQKYFVVLSYFDRLVCWLLNYQTLDQKASVRRGFPESVECNLDFDAKWEIPAENLVLGNVLGQGAFGIVRKGVLQEGDIWRDVAVKMLRGGYKYI